MLEPSLVTDALAASELPGGLPGLGPYPILQVFGGIISLIVLGVIALLYVKSQAPPAKAQSPDRLPPGGAGEGVHLYFDGPLKTISDRLGAESAVLQQLLALHYETREQIAQALQLTRHDIRSAIQEDSAEATLENSEIKVIMADVGKKLDDIRNEIIRLDEFVRARRVK